MKCEIVKDLLPSYLDGLTGQESNQEVETHMETCSACREFMNSMKTEITQDEIILNKKKIKPFRKLNRRVAKAVLVTFLTCVLVVAAYSYFFLFGWGVSSEDVDVQYSYENGTLNFDFTLTNDNVLTAWMIRDEPMDQSGMNFDIKFTQCFHSILDDRGKYPNEFSYGIGCENEDGTVLKFSENDSLTLKFRDKVVVYNLKDITEELGIS